MIMDSLSTSRDCLEIMMDLNGLEFITNLQKRYNQDNDIKNLLEKLWELFDENYQEFTSIEKFKKEVHLRMLRRGPVHTERFWQENYIFFNDEDNLKLIKILAEIINESTNEETLAVALFDLGEFAKYFSYGRKYLETLKVKPTIFKMISETDSAEVKKEAITAL